MAKVGDEEGPPFGGKKKIKEKENWKAFSFQRILNGNDFVILNIAEDWEEWTNYKVYNTTYIFSISMQVYADILR